MIKGREGEKRSERKMKREELERKTELREAK